MADLAKLVVSLEAQTAKYQKGLDRANKKLDRFNRTQEKQLKGLSNSFKAFGATVAAAISVDTVRQSVRLADEFNQLSTRIKTATRETGDFVRVQQDLASISVQTGASFETTIDTFQALSRVRKDLGATNAQFVTLTRVVNQLGVIGGASTSAISNGLRQFNQGLAAGVFRAEEFNSIVENLPELAFRIAQGLNKSTGELRQMVIDGKLLSADVFRVLLEQSEDIAEQFEEIPKNLDLAFNALRTSIGGALSELDKASGFTQTIAEALNEWAVAISIAAGNASPLLQAQSRLADLQEQLATEENKRGRNRTQFSKERIAGLRAEIELVKGYINLIKSNDSGPPPPSGDSNVIPIGRATPGINPTVTSRQIAPASDITDPSRVMTTRTDAMVEEFARGLTEMEERHQTFTTLFTDNLVQAADGGFDSILKSWARTLQQMAARALASQVFKLLGFGNAGGGFLGLGQLFGGARADGGPVSSGRAYLVGERGPELFVPGASGRIEPNGGGGTTINVNAPGSAPGMEQRIAAAVETAVAIADRNRQDARRRGK